MGMGKRGGGRNKQIHAVARGVETYMTTVNATIEEVGGEATWHGDGKGCRREETARGNTGEGEEYARRKDLRR